MNSNRISFVLDKNEYKVMNSNIPFIRFYCKRGSDATEVNIVACVDIIAKYNIDSEKLDSIAFQIERKFLFSGCNKVNFIYLIYSDDINRDKRYCEGKYNFWLIDVLDNRLVIFENQVDDFNGLKNQIENAIVFSNVEEIEKEKVNLKKIPWITILLILANVINFIYLEINGSTDDPFYMLKMGASYYENVLDKHEYYRLFTCMFMHFGIGHLIQNMFGLAILGHEAEMYFGRIKFTIIYIFSGIIGSVASVIYFSHIGTYAIAAGASGAIYGIMGALIVKIIEEKKKSRSAVQKMLIVLLLLYSAGREQGNVDSVAHIGGLAAGFIIGTILYFVFTRKSKSVEKQL